MTPIATIIRDPRYREFAAACCEHGRQVMPDSFPWKAMGMSTEDFLALNLRYEDGRPMGDNAKTLQLAMVRAQERLVEEWWDWWLGWTSAAQQLGRLPKATPAAMDGRIDEVVTWKSPLPEREQPATAKPAPGRLF